MHKGPGVDPQHKLKNEGTERRGNKGGREGRKGKEKERKATE
jgi:hypothetical protein